MTERILALVLKTVFVSQKMAYVRPVKHQTIVLRTVSVSNTTKYVQQEKPMPIVPKTVEHAKMMCANITRKKIGSIVPMTVVPLIHLPSPLGILSNFYQVEFPLPSRAIHRQITSISQFNSPLVPGANCRVTLFYLPITGILSIKILWMVILLSAFNQVPRLCQRSIFLIW